MEGLGVTTWWLGQPHVNLFLFFLKFKLNGFELGKIELGQVLCKPCVSVRITFQGRHDGGQPRHACAPSE